MDQDVEPLLAKTYGNGFVSWKAAVLFRLTGCCEAQRASLAQVENTIFTDYKWVS
jgi:hypothetical protein